MCSWGVLGVFNVTESIYNNSEVFRSSEMRVSLCAPPKLLHHYFHRSWDPINVTKSGLEVLKVEKSIGDVPRSTRCLENKIYRVSPPIPHFSSHSGGHISQMKMYSRVYIVYKLIGIIPGAIQCTQHHKKPIFPIMPSHKMRHMYCIGAVLGFSRSGNSLVKFSKRSDARSTPKTRFFGDFPLFFTILPILPPPQGPHTSPEGSLLCYLCLGIY